MTFKRALLIGFVVLAPALTGGPTVADETVPEQDEVMDVEVDAGVTDPRGDDESPNPREDNLICDNVVCGDETKICTSCGKSPR